MSRSNNQQPYFPHEANSRNRDRLIRLRMVHGVAGYGVYYMLLERLRSENNFKAELDYDILAFDFDCDIELIRSVISDFGLFVVTDEGTMFHSVELTEKMSYMLEAKQKRVEAARKAAECRWGKHTSDDTPTKGSEAEIRIETEEQSELPRDHRDRLQNEIDTLKKDEEWLTAISQDFKITREALVTYIDMFRLVCIGNGFSDGHPTIKDTKCHCRNYINKILSKVNGGVSRRKTKYVKESGEQIEAQRKKENEKYEAMLKNSQTAENVIRNKGYEPGYCSMRQLYDEEWVRNNPPTHPEWIGRFPGKETVQMVMETIKLEETVV